MYFLLCCSICILYYSFYSFIKDSPHPSQFLVCSLHCVRRFSFLVFVFSCSSSCFYLTLFLLKVHLTQYFPCEATIWPQCKSVFPGQPGWLSGLVLPLGQGVILETWDQDLGWRPGMETWDRVPHRAPCKEPATPSACVSASLSVFLRNK